MFVDVAQVRVGAGSGGDGAVSFRHEKYVDKGGPDGGDGGRGGNVIFVADATLNTLLNFRYKQELQAKNGEPGSKRKRHGKNGEDLIVKVPLGTVVTQGGNLLADMKTADEQVVIAKGGEGGYGNAHFVSSVRQAPRVAEVGEKGEHRELTLELKLLADVGLVGLPNAGKSTFLSVVSNATPEIADYPFTTLTPNLGVADIDKTTLLIADIPGLIEGAAAGKGLGDAFLKHVERTAVLLHLVDAYSNNVAHDYQVINHELAAYSAELETRPQVVALTKIEGLDNDLVTMQLQALQAVVPAETPLFAISSIAHHNLTPLLRELVLEVRQARQSSAEPTEKDELPIITLPAEAQARAWTITETDKGHFVVLGREIERFAARTNFESEHGIDRLRDIMHRMGIAHGLQRAGMQPGDNIQIGADGRPFTLEDD